MRILEGITILMGAEVDMRPMEGSSYSDELLEQCDVVVAPWCTWPSSKRRGP